MEKIRLLIIFGVAVWMYGCEQNKEQNSKTVMNEYEANAVKRFNFRSYEIGKDEVRDTSFTLPRKLLDDPMAFMEALTDVQMINRVWTDEYNYTEKLLFGDSILGKICKEVAASNRKPVFLIDEIQDEENHFYSLDVKKGGDRAYTSYQLTESGVRESDWKMSEFYRDLLDEWNKEEMFMIGGTDESKRIVTHTGRIISLSEVIGKESGCITRLRCDGDSVYVDMVKLYLWTLEDIMDEADEIWWKEQSLLRKQARQQGI